MPQVIEIPGKGQVEFPDGMSDDQIAAAIKRDSYYSEPSPVMEGLKETGRVVDQTVRGGAFAIPRAVKAGLDALSGLPDDYKPELMKLFDNVPMAGHAVDKIMTPMKPQTPVGQFVGAAGEGAVSSLAGPGNMVKNAVIGGGAGLGSEVSAKLFSDNMVSRLAGGLAGGGLTGVGLALTPTANSLAKRAVKDVTPADWRRAADMEKTLDSAGVPHLKSQLLGPSSSLDDVVQDASSNPAARGQLLNHTRNVAPAADNALNLWALKNLPVSVDERRMLMQGLQNQADDTINAAKGRANAAYSAALPSGIEREVYSSQYINRLRQELRMLARDPMKLGPDGKAAINKLITDDLTPAKGYMLKGDLNNIIKELNTKTQQDGYKGLPLKEVKDILKSFTPEFDPARAAKTKYMAENVDPMQQGLTGVIAQQGGGPRSDKYTAVRDVVGLVFPVDKAQPLAIRQLSRDLGGDTVGNLLGEHLTRNMQQATKSLSGQETSPAKFFESVVGTRAARQNVESAIMETAKANGVNPYAVRNGFYDLMQAFASFKDLKLAPGVDLASTRFEAGKSVAGAAIAPQSRMARYLWEKATAKTYKRIAELVTSKDGLAQLQAIAMKKDPAYTQSILLGTIAGAEAEQE